jgi:hypothetical protein
VVRERESYMHNDPRYAPVLKPVHVVSCTQSETTLLWRARLTCT